MTDSVEAPERIWIESEGGCPYFYHEEELSDAAPPVTEYVRADKLRAEIEALRAEVERLHADRGSREQQPAATSETVNVIGMPEFDGLLDHIYEHGTAAEGVIEKANAFARAVIARYAPQQPANDEVVFIDGVGAGRRSVESCRDGVQWIRVGDRVYWPLSESDAKRLQSACCGNGHFDGPSTPAADLEAAREDAERYRWLRKQHWTENLIGVVIRPKDNVRLGSMLPSLELLDDTIDRLSARAALAKEQA